MDLQPDRFRTVLTADRRRRAAPETMRWGGRPAANCTAPDGAAGGQHRHLPRRGGVRSTGARQEAELHRLRGEILLMQTAGGGNPSAAEAEMCFRRGIEIARRQEARALELRCATSLGRFLHRRGSSAEARGVLAPVYEWFSEGLETADMQAARTLLAQLR
jgi:hypothetical protein